MNRILKTTGSLLLIIVLGSFIRLHAQGKVITGDVTSSESKSGIAGVTVSVKGTRIATSTDGQGHFRLTVGNDATILLFTSVSYVAHEETISGRTQISITMDPDVKSIGEAVVTGYQTIKRRDLLASVSSIGSKDLKDIPINSAAEALNGRLAGVTATTSEGSPDATIRIRVRGGMSITGDNNPLFVIDGVQVENALNTISPQDIQTIDVLKDAAATAIYGARGANGVIVITTKHGRIGRPIVSYNSFIGIKELSKELDVLSPYEYVIYQSERSRMSGAPPNDSTKFADNFGHSWDTLSVYKNVAPVDWQNVLFGRTGITHNENLSVGGGTKKLTYNLGYTFNDDKAIVINSSYRRHLFNANADYKITNRIKLGVSGRYMNQNVYGSGVSDDKGSSYNRLRNAVKYRPFLSPNQDLNTPDPLADPNVGNGLNLTNPILLANSEYRRKTTDAYNGTGTLTVNLMKNLTFKSVFGYDYNRLIDRQFSDSLTPYSAINGAKKPIISLDTTIRKTITNSNVLTYSLKGYRNKHDLDVFVGEETYDLRTDIMSQQIKGYPAFTKPDDAFTKTTLGVSATGYPRLSKTRYTNASFLGGINYAYDGKYLLSFDIRADGASKFIQGKQWGYFPAGSVGWRVKKEKFMQNLSFLNDLKLRFGFGTVGNNRIKDYAFLTTFSNNGTYFYGLNNNAVISYYPAGLVNENLQWESTVSRNYGVDASILNNRVYFSVDVYKNTSSHLLLDVPIASTYGYATQVQNIGKTSNKGVEIQLNGSIIKTKNFNWTASFNISFNKNKILQLGQNQVAFFPQASWGVSGQPTDYIERVGDPVGSMWGLVYAGHYTTDDFDYNIVTGEYKLKSNVPSDALVIGSVMPGSIKFVDLNHDGVVDIDHDRKIIGNPTPKFTGGFSQTFSFKRWDASLFFNFVSGNSIYNANKIEFTNGYTNDANMLSIMKDRWRTISPTGQTVEWATSTQVFGIAPDQLTLMNKDAKYWIPLKGTGASAFIPSSWAIEDGSFLRLNNLTIGYSLPITRLAGLKMSKLRFYLTGNNIFVLTNYTGYDPEVNVRSSPLTPGLDYSAYPKSRSFIFGLNATF